MIDEITRRRWRALFSSATVGPWAAEHQRDASNVVAASLGGLRVGVSFHTHHDAALTAEARIGWPRTLEAMEAAERERDEARNDIERAQAAHLATLHESLALLRDTETTRDGLAGAFAKMGDMCERAQSDCAAFLAELEKLRPLHDALRTWARYRDSTTLLATWRAHEEQCRPKTSSRS